MRCVLLITLGAAASVLAADEPAAVLASDAPLEKKFAAFRQLSLRGGAAEVSVAAGFLDDDNLAHMARFALERIPGKAAGEALFAAAGRLDGVHLAGVADSIGRRGGPGAHRTLAPLLDRDDAVVAASAARALAQLGTKEAAETLAKALQGGKNESRRIALATALLRCASALQRQDGHGVAAPFFQSVARQSGLPQHLILAATRGEVASGGEGGAGRVVEWLRAPDEDRFQLGLDLAQQLPGRELTAALAREVGELPPPRAAALANALAFRGDPAAVKPLLGLASRVDPPAREAAIRAVGRLGDAHAAAPLFRLAEEGGHEFLPAVRAALVMLPGEATDKLLCASIDAGRPPEIQRLALEVAAGRGALQAAPPAAGLLESPDPATRTTALATLEKLGDHRQLPAVLAFLADPENAPLHQQAQKTIVEIYRRHHTDDAACEAALRAAWKADAAKLRGPLLRILPVIGSPGALEAVRAMLAGNDPALRTAARNALLAWRSPIAAPDLLALFRRSAGDPDLRAKALKACLQLAGKGPAPPVVRAEQCRLLKEAATSDDERREIQGLLDKLLKQAGPATEDEAGFRPIFDGATLDGWEGKPGWWSVENGAITSISTPDKPVKNAHYLFWTGGRPSDFELRFSYQLAGGNSGVQFRSRKLPGWDAFGYQADIEAGDKWTGAIFAHQRGGVALRGQSVDIDESGKRVVLPFADPAGLKAFVRKDGWNDYRIVAQGSEMALFINGHLMCHANDRDRQRALNEGWIGLQMHPGPPMTVRFKNLRLRELPPRKK